MSEMTPDSRLAAPSAPLPLPWQPDDAVSQGTEHANPRQHPHRPLPDPRTGELKIDPDIVLKAKKFNLTLSFFYSSHSTQNAEYGQGRGASVRGQVVSGSGGAVTLIRGDFRQYGFSLVGTSGGITTYVAAVSQGTTTTLSYDGTRFTEYFNDGMQLLYQAQTGGPANTFQLAQVKDADGVAQTYTYGTGAEAGLLKSIQVPGGNLVTFLYAAGSGTSLLQTVQDWGGRRWTFQYDASNYMTTMSTPLGCQTGYTYSSGRRQRDPGADHHRSSRLRHLLRLRQQPARDDDDGGHGDLDVGVQRGRAGQRGADLAFRGGHDLQL